MIKKPTKDQIESQFEDMDLDELKENSPAYGIEYSDQSEDDFRKLLINRYIEMLEKGEILF